MNPHKCDRLIELLEELGKHFSEEEPVWRSMREEIETLWHHRNHSRPNILPPDDLDKWGDWVDAESNSSVRVGELIEGAIFCPKSIQLSVGCAVTGSIFACDSVTVQRDVVLYRDVISRKRIEWQGKRVRSLIAPRVHLDQSVHALDIYGSIVCHSLGLTPNHLSGQIRGFLLVARDGSKTKRGARTKLKVKSGSRIGGLKIPYGVQLDSDVRIGRLDAGGDVTLGVESQVETLKGEHVRIGARSTLGCVYARGGLDIDSNTTIKGTAIAQHHITLEAGVQSEGRMLACVEGEIRVKAESDNWVTQPQYRYNADVGALLASESQAAVQTGRTGQIALAWLPHNHYYALKECCPGCLPELEPIGEEV